MNPATLPNVPKPLTLLCCQQEKPQIKTLLQQLEGEDTILQCYGDAKGK